MTRTALTQPRTDFGGEIPHAATAVINTTMSPYCPGLLLANCPSPSADSLRRALVDHAARGATESQLRSELRAVYGDAVNATPDAAGFGLLAWAAPFVLLLAVGALIPRWMVGRLRRPALALDHAGSAAVAPVRDPLDAEQIRRIERIVRHRD